MHSSKGRAGNHADQANEPCQFRHHAIVVVRPKFTTPCKALTLGRSHLMFMSASHQDRQPTPDAKSYIDYIDLNDPCRNRASSCTSSVKTMFTVSVCAYYSFLILYISFLNELQVKMVPCANNTHCNLSIWVSKLELGREHCPGKFKLGREHR